MQIDAFRGRARRDPWWKEGSDSQSVASSIFTTVQMLDDMQEAQRGALLHHLRLYSNRQASSFTGQEYSSAANAGQQIRLNVVKSCIDTALAHIATNKPRPLYQTSGGDFEQREPPPRFGKFIL